MFNFDKDIEIHLKEFKKFKENYLLCSQKLSNLHEKFEYTQKELQAAKEREIKKSQIILTTQNICKQQLETIKNLKLLTQEYRDVKHLLELKQQDNVKLHEKIKILKEENDLQLESQSIDYEKEMEKQKEMYEIQVQDLQEEITLILASSEIQKSELENEVKSIKIKYEEELKNVKYNNNRLQSTVIIYEKQKHEVEEKCRLLELEKKQLSSYQTVSSTKVGDNSVNKTQNLNSYSRKNQSPNMHKYFKQTLQNKHFNKASTLESQEKEQKSNLENSQKSNSENLNGSFSKNNFDNVNDKSYNAAPLSVEKTKNTSENLYNCKNYDYFENTAKNNLDQPQRGSQNVPQNENIQQFDNLQKYDTNEYCKNIYDKNFEVHENVYNQNKCIYQNNNIRRDNDNFLKPQTINYSSNRKFSCSESDFSSDSENERSIPRNFQNFRSFKCASKPQRVVFKTQSVPSNMMPLPIVAGNKKENTSQFSIKRKRKLFNPQNTDNLEDNLLS